jgi:hypothetical protein
VIDAVRQADAVEGDNKSFFGAIAFGELDAVVGQDRMDFVSVRPESP